MNNEFRIQQLFALVKNNIDWSNPIPACLTIAGELEKVTTLKGPQKLKVLQDVLKFGLTEANIDHETKKTVLGFVEDTLPQVMQAAILASKHPVVNQALSACFTCLKK
jgi:hypothetical protein